MKKLLGLLLIILLHTFMIFPQDRITDYRRTDNRPPLNSTNLHSNIKYPVNSGVWTEINPKIPRVDYIGLDFINIDTGWCVGINGVVIKTTDGGLSWTTCTSGTKNNLLKIKSYSGQVVIATGYDGLIIRSSDGGMNFSPVSSGFGANKDFWGLEFINDTLIWACGMGNALIKSTNAGLTWSTVNPLSSNYYWCIEFLNKDYGFISGSNGKILKTTDGGITWEQKQAGNTSALYSLEIIDSLHIVAAGANGKTVYSSDGGETWIQNSNISVEAVNCVKFISIDTGYVVGLNASFKMTTNRGVLWYSIGTNNGEWEFELFPEVIGYSVGSQVIISKATGTYYNWQKLFFVKNFQDVSFLTKTKGFVITNETNGLYRTLNCGNSWDLVPGGPGGYCIIFIDSITGFIGEEKIYKTTNGGDNWFQTNINGLTSSWGEKRKIFFINNLVGWAVTSTGGIIKTTDGGENWNAQLNTSLSVGFRSIYMIDSSIGWTANGNKRPFKTTDGGTNWIEQTYLSFYSLEDIYFNDTSSGFGLDYNEFYRISDNGLTWTLSSELFGFGSGKFIKYGNDYLFVIGTRSYRSINGGGTWVLFSEIDSVTLKSLSLISPGYGFAVGEMGLIMKYSDDSVPVDLLNFECTISNKNVTLRWSTSTETNNKGFYVERRNSLKWETVDFIKGSGTTTNLTFYNYIDSNTPPGKYYYRLKQIDYNGGYSYSKEIKAEIEPLSNFILYQNYPNPFNPSTKLIYEIPHEGLVILKIYDILGKEIKELVHDIKQPGKYEEEFRSNDLSSGIYFCTLSSGDRTSTIKLLVIK